MNETLSLLTVAIATGDYKPKYLHYAYIVHGDTTDLDRIERSIHAVARSPEAHGLTSGGIMYEGLRLSEVKYTPFVNGTPCNITYVRNLAL